MTHDNFVHVYSINYFWDRAYIKNVLENHAKAYNPIRCYFRRNMVIEYNTHIDV